MALSRRAFLGGFAHSGVASPVLPPAADEVRIGGNENPLGPGKHALDALVAQFDQSNRYQRQGRKS